MRRKIIYIHAVRSEAVYLRGSLLSHDSKLEIACASHLHTTPLVTLSKSIILILALPLTCSYLLLRHRQRNSIAFSRREMLFHLKSSKKDAVTFFEPQLVWLPAQRDKTFFFYLLQTCGVCLCAQKDVAPHLCRKNLSLARPGGRQKDLLQCSSVCFICIYFNFFFLVKSFFLFRPPLPQECQEEKPRQAIFMFQSAQYISPKGDKKKRMSQRTLACASPLAHSDTGMVEMVVR